MSLTLTLAVQDLECTENFYRAILGFPAERFVPIPGAPPVLHLAWGEAHILFREQAALATLHPALFQNLDRHPPGVGMALEFTVKDLAPLQRAVARRRLHILYELEDDEFGRREIWLHDPDGYLLVLQQETEPSG